MKVKSKSKMEQSVMMTMKAWRKLIRKLKTKMKVMVLQQSQPVLMPLRVVVVIAAAAAAAAAAVVVVVVVVVVVAAVVVADQIE